MNSRYVLTSQNSDLSPDSCETESMPEFNGKRVDSARVLASGAISRWKSLTLNGTRVDDEGLIQICSLATRLSEVHICSDLISDDSMPALCALPNLRSLLLDGVPHVTDKGIACIALVLQLRELYLNGTQLTDARMDVVATKTDVWSLSVAGTKITDAGVRKLTSLTSLSILALDGTQVDGSGLDGIPADNRIYLYLNRCPISDAALNRLVATHRRIQLLGLNDTPVTDACLTAVSELPELEDLRLERTAITDAGVRALVGHRKLYMLYLAETGVSDDMIAALTSQAPKGIHVIQKSYGSS